MIPAAVFPLLLAVTVAVCAATERVVWKPLVEAILRIDDKPAKTWNVYRPEKKEPLVLVQLGRRFLMIDYRAKEVYELDPERLEHKDKDLLWHETDKPAKPLPTEDWMVRDAGPVRRIRMKLTDEGRVLEVQVRIQPDLRWAY